MNRFLTIKFERILAFQMNKYLKVLIHLIVWSIPLGLLFLSGFQAVFAQDPINAKKILFVQFGIYGVINISLFYFNLLILVPYTFGRKKYLLYFISSIGTIFIFWVIKYLIAISFKDFILMVGPGHRQIQKSVLQYAISTIFVSGLMLFFSMVYYLVKDWFLNDKIKRELENQTLTAELAFLKSQINPHFLFNSLNNIYSLVISNSEKAAESIQKLSELMRYMLQENKDNRTDLSIEINYLNNYMEMQKLRMAKPDNIQMTISGKCEGKRVMPLLLISFVENAFKHGDFSEPIILNLNIEETKLIFKLSNKKNLRNKDTSSGIGLKNIKRRLDLLYASKYFLDIVENDGNYEVNLELELL